MSLQNISTVTTTLFELAAYLWTVSLLYRYNANSYFNNLRSSVTVVMQKDKEENSHHDSHYRARELAALAAYDHHHLDGEMFLQVSTGNAHYVEQPIFTISFGRSRILKMHIGSTRSHIYRAEERHLLPPRSFDRSSQFANRSGEIHRRVWDLSQLIRRLEK